MAAPVHAEHALAAAHDLLAVVETEAEADFILAGVIARGFLHEVLSVAEVADAQRRLVDERRQLFGRKDERRFRFLEIRAQLRRSAGERERRVLRCVLRSVVDLETGLVDNGEPELPDVRFDEQGLALQLVGPVVTEIGNGRRCRYREQGRDQDREFRAHSSSRIRTDIGSRSSVGVMPMRSPLMTSVPWVKPSSRSAKRLVSSSTASSPRLKTIMTVAVSS